MLTSLALLAGGCGLLLSEGGSEPQDSAAGQTPTFREQPLPLDAPALLGLKAHYAFDEDGGLLLRPSFAGPSCTLNGEGARGPGVSGGALVFDGSVVGADCSFDPALTHTGDTSVALWLRIDSWFDSATDFKAIVSVNGPGEAEEYNGLFILSYRSGADGGVLRYLHESGDNPTDSWQHNNVPLFAATAELPSAQWLHLAVVRSVAEQRVEIFVDGEPWFAGSYDRPPTGGQSGWLSFGYTRNPGLGITPGPQQVMRGAIDEFYLYHRVLSVDEIRALRRRAVPPE